MADGSGRVLSVTRWTVTGFGDVNRAFVSSALVRRALSATHTGAMCVSCSWAAARVP
jgi:hypothetical protein